MGLEAAGEESVALSGESAICSHLHDLQGTLVLRDDYVFWQRHKFSADGGKPIWILKDSGAGAPFHVFFDDNFRVDTPANSILHPRLVSKAEDTNHGSGFKPLGGGFKPQGSLDPRVAAASGCLAQVCLADCVLQDDAYVELVKLLESRWEQSEFT